MSLHSQLNSSPATPPNEPLLRIGELAHRSRVPIKTIRYYEEIGLLHAAKRTEGGFRLFFPDVLPRLDFIRRSQQLGLSLQEIGHLLIIHDKGTLPCDDVRQTLKAKIEDIDQRIQELATLKVQLQKMISGPETSSQWQSDVICPLIQPDLD